MLVRAAFVTGVTQQHSSSLRSVLETTWHPCVSYSSLLCGDSSSTRLLILYCGIIYQVDITCAVENLCRPVSRLRKTCLLVKCCFRGGFYQSVEKFNPPPTPPTHHPRLNEVALLWRTFPCLWLSRWMFGGACGDARRRRVRGLGQFLPHERLSVAVAWAEKLHHTSRGQKMARAGEVEVHDRD